VFSVEAGTTYYVQGSTFFWGDSQLRMEIKAVSAPANDDFADATAIGSLPFSDRPVLSVASSEPGEPSTCVGANQKTVWYAFTPAETGSYVVERSGGPNPLAVYTGSSLTSLHEVACAGFSSAVFRADAGTTYYLQLAAGFFASSPIELSVRVAPPAMASFFYYPSDPSSFDTVSFYDMSWDVAQIASRLWGFGDGATATDCCPAHRYAADGEYAAKLAITTTDGRSASATQNVAVKTHDVAITKLSAPKTGHVGQSREITVGVQNTRYAETVELALLRSVPGGGFEHVGQVIKDVPARDQGRTTTFSIAYTVTPEDAVFGKVTFQAIATIVGARDANPADNRVIALPTKVAR
jgi:PKD repeat protein